MAAIIWYWTCETSTGAMVGVHNNGDGTVSPTCTTDYGAWQTVPAPWYLDTVPADQIGPLFAAVLMLWAVAWLARKVGENIED